MRKDKIKLILFDFNGVAVIGSHKDTMKYLARNYGHQWQDLYRIFYTKYHNLLAVKKISLKESWEKPLKQFNIPLTWKKAVDIHNSFPRLNRSVINTAGKLRKDYKCVVISKNVREYWRFYKKNLGFHKYFDEVINLQEYKLPKASAKTLNFICQRYKVKPEEIIYIDDQSDNLRIPKKKRVKTILYQNFSQFRKELENYLK